MISLESEPKLYNPVTRVKAHAAELMDVWNAIENRDWLILPDKAADWDNFIVVGTGERIYQCQTQDGNEAVYVKRETDEIRLIDVVGFGKQTYSFVVRILLKEDSVLLNDKKLSDDQQTDLSFNLNDVSIFLGSLTGEMKDHIKNFSEIGDFDRLRKFLKYSWIANREYREWRVICTSNKAKRSTTAVLMKVENGTEYQMLCDFGVQPSVLSIKKRDSDVIEISYPVVKKGNNVEVRNYYNNPDGHAAFPYQKAVSLLSEVLELSYDVCLPPKKKK